MKEKFFKVMTIILLMGIAFMIGLNVRLGLDTKEYYKTHSVIIKQVSRKVSVAACYQSGDTIHIILEH